MSVSVQSATFALSFCQRQSMESLEARRFHGERSPPHPFGATWVRSSFDPFNWHNLAFDPLQSVTMFALTCKWMEMAHFQALLNVLAVVADKLVVLLLCASKDSEVVEYALSRTLSPALVAQYQTQLPHKQMLAAKLHELYVLNLPEPAAAVPTSSRGIKDGGQVTALRRV